MSTLPYRTPHLWDEGAWTQFGEIGDGGSVVTHSSQGALLARSSAATQTARASRGAASLSARSSAATQGSRSGRGPSPIIARS